MFPIIISAGKHISNPINLCIRTWFQISAKLIIRQINGFIPINLRFYCYLGTCFMAYCNFLVGAERFLIRRVRENLIEVIKCHYNKRSLKSNNEKIKNAE